MRFWPLLAGAGFVLAVVAEQASAAETYGVLVNGQQRSYLLTRPAVAGPRPTVLLLHGTGTDAAQFSQTVPVAAIGEREGFVTVYPDTADSKWWNVFPPGYVSSVFGPRAASRFGANDDVAFIKALVADLVRRGISDPKRIYLSGMSFGGFMSLRIACTAPEQFAAIGIIYASMPEATGQNCQPSKPLPIVMMNGTADRVVPYAGGTTAVGFNVWSTDQTLAFFRKLDGCSDTADQSQLPRVRAGQTYVIQQRWAKCARPPVVLYQIVGGGHRIRGSLNDGFNAYETLWAFFRNQTLDSR